jgi:hypothetical protein
MKDVKDIKNLLDDRIEAIEEQRRLKSIQKEVEQKILIWTFENCTRALKVDFSLLNKFIND